MDSSGVGKETQHKDGLLHGLVSAKPQGSTGSDYSDPGSDYSDPGVAAPGKNHQNVWGWVGHVTKMRINDTFFTFYRVNDNQCLMSD